MFQQKISESELKNVRKNLTPVEARTLQRVYHNIIPKVEVYRLLLDVGFEGNTIPSHVKHAILGIWEKGLVTLEQKNPKELGHNDIVEITKEGMDLCMLTDLRIE